MLPLFVRSKAPTGLPACLYKTKRIVMTIDDPEKKVGGTWQVVTSVCSSRGGHGPHPL